MENLSKKKRGRPRILPQHLDLINRLHIADGQSHRSKMNAVYATMARNRLGLKGDVNTGTFSSDKYQWLCDAKRQTILTELGRIYSDEDLETVAAALCKEKPLAQAAVKIIRDLRNGKNPPALADELAREIEAFIKRVRARYPQATNRMMSDAMLDAYFDISDLAEREEADEEEEGD